MGGLVMGGTEVSGGTGTEGVQGSERWRARDGVARGREGGAELDECDPSPRGTTSERLQVILHGQCSLELLVGSKFWIQSRMLLSIFLDVR